MVKKRVAIPDATRAKVLDEYNHLCAICGGQRPQIHHIDEDPSNNDPMNLIPLCPNHHFVDIHDPTKPIEPGKLRLFRQYKDPTILKPQFHPLFVRLQFLDDIKEDPTFYDLREKAIELVDFIAGFEMGVFYSKRVEKLIVENRLTFGWVSLDGERDLAQERRES